MNAMNAANGQYWDAQAEDWERLRDADQLWRRCPREPELAFEGEVLACICGYVGDLHGKQVCVIGSGDNYAAFALAGMGARVTSTDISGRQLEVARRRAEALGLELEFVRADATLQMPPYDLWLQGIATIQAWLLGRGSACRGSRLVPIAASGGPAFGQYKPEGDGFVAWSLITLDVVGERVAGMTHFLDCPTYFPRFGLPLRLPA
mgnify:CR=1 FL=1